MGKINTYYWPRQHKEYEIDFTNLSGGLNLRDAETKLNPNESPEAVNLIWENGILQSRPGQEYATERIGREGFAATDTPFWGNIFLHCGDRFYTLPQGDDDSDPATLPQLIYLYTGVPQNRGTFFRFGDYLFYKNRGGFFKIAYNPNTGGFTVTDVTENAFVPTILINANPETGSGDIYQPENRLSPRKKVTYNASATEETVIFSESNQKPDGVRRAFNLGKTSDDQLRGVLSVYIGANYQPSALYTVSLGSGVILFNEAPKEGETVTVTLSIGTLSYHLPVPKVDSIDSVKVDGIEWRRGQDYTIDLNSGVVTFQESPPVTDPPTNNTVEIIYSKSNPDALAPVMNCDKAAVYSSGNQFCIVLGGDTGRIRSGKIISQPNAIFWSGNTQTGFDPSYFPMDGYNLLGDTQDAVTGFGKQYDSFIVFKERSIGKLTVSIDAVNERNVINLLYTRVNDRIGCDLPYSIQIVQNNLTFANTGLNGSPGGIYIIRSASSAYENNVDRVSGKIDGTVEKPGLLYDLETAGRGNVCSHDDGKKYYLCVNHHAWVWDYTLDSWFFWTGFDPVSWFMKGETSYHLNASGRITKLGILFTDYNQAFRKVYVFPLRDFGTLEKLKQVRKIILSVRSETAGDMDIIYRTNLEKRTDRVKLTVAGNDRFTVRNLEERDLSADNTPKVFVRKPMCNHIRHFSFSIESTAGNLSVISAQVFYRFQGDDRG